MAFDDLYKTHSKVRIVHKGTTLDEIAHTSAIFVGQKVFLRSQANGADVHETYEIKSIEFEGELAIANVELDTEM